MNKPPKSDPPSLKLDAPFMKELATYGLGAFDDPEEITQTTMAAAKAIIDDQKTNRRDVDSTKSLLAILAVVTKHRMEQRATKRVLQIIALVAAVLFVLDKAGVITFTLGHH